MIQVLSPEETTLFTVRDSSGRALIKVTSGTLLIDALTRIGVALGDASCGRVGVCGKCRARTRSGASGPWQEVLSCQMPVLSDITVDLPAAQPQRRDIILEEAATSPSTLAPLVRKLFIEALPGGAALAWEQLCTRANIQATAPANLSVLQQLAACVNPTGPFTAVIFDGKIIAVEAGDTRHALCGMAFDVGTTTVVGYLLDLRDGRLLATVSALNPQAPYGADVISRVTMAEREPGGLERLRDLIVDCINRLIAEATASSGIASQDVYDCVLVGNPCMQHLFFGIQPASLGKAPYQPILRDQVTVPANDAGVRANKAAQLSWLPAVAGFVGADTIGMLLAHPLHDLSGVTLALDIGTNGEMVLSCRGKLRACSTAAGPAFEGTAMTSGIRAQVGAIDKVWAGERGLEYHVIGDARPRGICGSGVVDAVAALLDMDLISESGRLLRPDERHLLAARFSDRKGCLAFTLVPAADTEDGREIVITQNDVRQLQLAKGAITTGLLMLLGEAQVSLHDVDRVLLAGAFGVYLRRESIRKIGLLPESLCDKIQPVGNAAGAGAQVALLAADRRRFSQELARGIRYVELAGRPDFTDRFVEELSFPAK